MSSKDESDEASRGSKEASSTESLTTEPQSEIITESVPSSEIEQDGMKRAAAKKLIERYFYQLIDGCGNPNCSNRNCASSGEIRNLSPNEAAAQAIQLFTQEARLCEPSPHKVPRTNTHPPTPGHCSQDSVFPSNSKDGLTSSIVNVCGTSKDDTTFRNLGASSSSSSSDHLKENTPKILTEERMEELCSQWETSPHLLASALSEAFSKRSCLARCFPAKKKVIENTEEDKPPENAGGKEAWRAKGKDPDKDEDTVAEPSLDMDSCRRGFEHLKKVPASVYSSSLITSLIKLSENITSEVDDISNCFLIVFEIPGIGSGDYLESALPALCEAAANLSSRGQAKLARKWAAHSKDNMRYMLEALQQLITIRVMSTTYNRNYYIQDDPRVTTATKLMKVLYYANLIAGVMESSDLREEEITVPGQLDPLGDALDHLNPYSSSKQTKQAQADDLLAIKLKVDVLDCRKPYIPFQEFYNETLSDNIEMDKDFAYYKTETPQYMSKKSRRFSFMRHSFILTPATKSLGLYYDNRIRMYSERRVSFLHAVVGASTPMPYLRLKVRRQHLIDDALIELEMVAMERVLDLKKQLVVEFEGEQGVDEGGVSKEFFQLIVEEIFNPDYGMFTLQPDTHTMWFNPTSFETEAQFTLIGIVLGLAIYNNIILAVNFPMVVYRKLMGKKGSFEDLADWNPILYGGLKSFLDHTGDDMQDVFVQTFRICYQDVFGNNIFHELKENGDQIFVTQENKQEFVDTYADFLMNKSVDCQFKAFRRGFIMVTGESPLSLLFRPEEIEQLVCGSKNFDFNELQMATEYDGGYTADSQIIKDFWLIVHDLPLEDKRKLLQFATGSDRVPVGGLIRLKLIIARNGPDSDRLPTAHTCFNVLLLPEYETKEKLNDRLLKAINYAKGFGML